jgi:ATP-binding cassette subfamily B protein
MSTVKKVLGAIKKYRFLLALSIILATVTVGLTLYIPIIIGDAIDLIIDKGNVDFNMIWKLLVNVIIISIAIALLQWIMNSINNKITFNVTRDIRNQAFDKLEKLPLKYIDSHSYGEILSKMVSDVDELANGLLMGFTQFFTGIMTIIGTLAFMISINYVIAIVVVCLTPISLVVAYFISKRTFSLFKVQSEARAEQTSIIDECIGNIKVVKAFSHEDEASEEFDIANEKLSKASINAIFFSSLVNPTT